MENPHRIYCERDLDVSDYKRTIEQMLGIGIDDLKPANNKKLDDIDTDNLELLYINESRRRKRMTSEQSVKLTAMLLESRARQKSIADQLQEDRYQQKPELVRDFKNAEKVNTAIKQIFFERNGGLLVSIAARYRFTEVPFSDLVGMAAEGMYRALEDFNGSTEFGTYASWWIRKSIQNSLPEYDPHLVTGRRFHRLRRIVSQAENQFAQEHHRLPSKQELAKEAAKLEWEGMSVKEKGLRTIEEYIRKRSETIIEYMILMEVSTTTKIIGEPHNEGRQESSGSSSDMYEPPAQELTPEELALLKLLNGHIEKALFSLTPREMKVLQLRFGLFGIEPLSVAEIAKNFGVTKRRIHQIIEISLEKVQRKYGRLIENLAA